MAILKATKAKSSLKAQGPIQLPLVGEVLFDEKNSIEVPDEHVEELIKLQPHFEFHKISEDGEDLTLKEESPATAEARAYEEEINKLSINEINALLENFPGETVGLKRKTEKVAFLVKKQYPKD